jgi:hypothetical protein
MLGMRAYALRIRAEFHKSVPPINSKERAAFPQECDRRRKIPRAATCSMIDRPLENLCHRRSLNSFIAFDHFAYLRPGESVQGPVIKPD